MIVLAVMLFHLAAVLGTKDVIKPLPLMFSFFKPCFSFMKVVYLRLKPFSTVRDDIEHLLLMLCAELQSNIKIFVLTVTKSRTLKDRP